MFPTSKEGNKYVAHLQSREKNVLPKADPNPSHTRSLLRHWIYRQLRSSSATIVTSLNIPDYDHPINGPPRFSKTGSHCLVLSGQLAVMTCRNWHACSSTYPWSDTTKQSSATSTSRAGTSLMACSIKRVSTCGYSTEIKRCVYY